jgi:hypothetical protein
MLRWGRLGGRRRGADYREVIVDLLDAVCAAGNGDRYLMTERRVADQAGKGRSRGKHRCG